MRYSFSKSLATVAALVALGATPALAQTTATAGGGTLGAGVSFLRDGDIEETGVGFTVDYSSDFRTTENNLGIGWVGDLGFHHFEFNNLTSFMGGVRVTGRGNPSVTWFGQFLIGAARTSAAGDLADDCDDFDIDCSATDLAFAPGFGVNIPVGDRASFRGQIDFLIISTEGESVSAQRFWFGLALPVGQ